jgi:hypothetical protein
VEEAAEAQHPHDDALVVSMMVSNYTTQRILIDKGYTIDILYMPTFEQMGLPLEKLLAVSSLMVGFVGNKVYPVGTITLLVTAGTLPKHTIVMVVGIMCE